MRIFFRAYIKSYNLLYTFLKLLFSKKYEKKSLIHRSLMFFILLMLFIFKRLAGFSINLFSYLVLFSYSLVDSFKQRMYGRGSFHAGNRNYSIKAAIKSSLISHAMMDEFFYPARRRIFKNKKSKWNFNPVRLSSSGLKPIRVFHRNASLELYENCGVQIKPQCIFGGGKCHPGYTINYQGSEYWCL